MARQIMEEEKAEFNRTHKDNGIPWGYDILRACHQDSTTFLHIFRFDGYFNKALKKAFNFFWKGMRDGQEIFTLQEKWDALPPKEKQ